MNRAAVNKILKIQEAFGMRSEHQILLAECEIRNAQFLEQLETMNEAQPGS